MFRSAIQKITVVKSFGYTKCFSSSDLPPHLILPNGRRLKRPDEPSPGECCGKGCTDCVWTMYWEEKQAYAKQVEEGTGMKVAPDPFAEFERRLEAEAERRRAIQPVS